MAEDLVRLELDNTELERDLEAVENGKLSLPTVSSVKVGLDEMIVYLDEDLNVF